MRPITSYFSCAQEYFDPSEIAFPPNSILFYTENLEERSTLFSDPIKLSEGVNRVYIDEQDGEMIKLKSSVSNNIYSLRSATDATEFTKKFENRPVFLDITGLTHSAWAWIVRSMLKRAIGDFWVIYSEPLEYKFHEFPFDGQLFDLSERINGIAPLPSFASLTNYTSDNSIFMPLLGFEGARLAHILENVQPSKRLTFPVIGIPGFNFDFPFYTYQGNKPTLEREGIWKNYRYEKANCPVSIYILGKDLLNEYSNKYLRIALIGTKPHALGAILLKLSYPNKVDLIYDHPMRKKNRTKGKSKTLCYYLNPFKENIA